MDFVSSIVNFSDWTFIRTVSNSEASQCALRLSVFNLYVALSRSSAGRDTIRLLRDFDGDMSRKSQSSALL